MNRRRPWTAEEEQELSDLAAHGASTIRMAARLRRSRMAIEGRLSVLRVRARKDPATNATTGNPAAGMKARPPVLDAPALAVDAPVLANGP